MKIDLAYMNKILGAFISAETAHIFVSDFPSKQIPIENMNSPGRLDEKFLFHIQLAAENGLISDRDLSFSGLSSIGIQIGAGGGVTLVDTPIRITQQGHEFASALNNKEILLKLKSELKDAPFRTIFDGSQKLLDHYFKKKLSDFLDDSTS